VPNVRDCLAKATNARVELQTVVISSLNHIEGEIGNPLKRADSAGPPQDQPERSASSEWHRDQPCSKIPFW
jgi:hypothetical protein